MKNATSRKKTWGIGAGLILLVGAVLALAQGPPPSITVTAVAGSPTPNPVCVGQTVQVPLYATVTNPPPGGYTGPSPNWVWIVLTVQYRASQAASWQTVDESFGWAAVIQDNPASAQADLFAGGTTGGYYKVTLQATYSDLATPTVTASGTVSVEATVVQVQFNPGALLMVPGTSAALTGSVLPTDWTGTLSCNVDETTIASLTGSLPSLSVTASSAIAELSQTAVNAHLGSGGIGPKCGICVVTVSPDAATQACSP